MEECPMTVATRIAVSAEWDGYSVAYSVTYDGGFRDVCITQQGGGSMSVRPEDLPNLIRAF